MLLSDVLTTLEADTFDFWEDSARRPGGARGREDGLLGNATNVASMLERVRRWNLPARWIISTANAPDGLERALEDGGCSLMEDAPGMIARIDELPAPRAADVNVEVVRDQAAFDEWADVFCDAFGIPENAAPHIHTAASFTRRYRRCLRHRRPARISEAGARCARDAVDGSRGSPPRRTLDAAAGDSAGVPRVREARLSNHHVIQVVADRVMESVM